MSNEILEIVWSDKFSFIELLSMNEEQRKEYEVPGVYLWIRPARKGVDIKLIAYVGRSKDLWWRQLTHYRNQIGGFYYVPSEFREGKPTWVPTFGEKIDVPGEESPRDIDQVDFLDVVTNRDNFIKLVSSSFDLAQMIEIYLAPLNNMEINSENASLPKFKEIEGRIERNLLYDLQPKDTIVEARTEPGKKEKMFIKHRNAEWLEEISIQKFLSKNNRKIKEENDTKIVEKKNLKSR